MTARESCPACGGATARVAARLPYGLPPLITYLQRFYPADTPFDFNILAGDYFELMDCVDCACLYQKFVPAAAVLGRFYAEAVYGGTVPVTRFSPYEIEHQVRELMMVVRFLQPGVPTPRVLDFGTGNGRWARLAAAAGLDAHACDLSEHAFARLTASGVTCHRLDTLPEDTFDLINCEQVFEHLPEPVVDVRRIARALRPGGILKIGVPHDPGLRKKLQAPDWLAAKNTPASLNAVAPLEHLNHFEPSSLRALGGQAGLKIMDVRGWDLVGPDQIAPRRIRSLPGQWLRQRLGDFYRSFHPLTQTVFLQKTGSA